MLSKMIYGFTSHEKSCQFVKLVSFSSFTLTQKKFTCLKIFETLNLNLCK